MTMFQFFMGAATKHLSVMKKNFTIFIDAACTFCHLRK